MNSVRIMVAKPQHSVYATQISELIELSAQQRGTGIAKRAPEYIEKRINNGNAIIALGPNGALAGFCYIETWEHGKYVANSGLIVAHDYRKTGVASHIKKKAFELSRQKFPEAKIIGLTTSLAVMKINSKLGYNPVTFSELTKDDSFWKGCSTCVNYDVLTRTKRSHCLCTGMMYDPKKKSKIWDFMATKSILERLKQFKNNILLKKQPDNDDEK